MIGGEGCQVDCAHANVHLYEDASGKVELRLYLSLVFGEIFIKVWMGVSGKQFWICLRFGHLCIFDDRYQKR